MNLDSDCIVAYRDTPGFAGVYDYLADHVEWTPETYRFGGACVTTRRKSCAYGDPGLTYRYSGQTKPALPWLPAIRMARDSVAPSANFCLLNLYPDGKAGIGLHSDDEPDLDLTQPIVTVSLGATRRICFVEKVTGKKVTELELRHGSILVMGGETQRRYKHGVPNQPSVKAPRISLTFRTMR